MRRRGIDDAPAEFAALVISGEPAPSSLDESASSARDAAPEIRSAAQWDDSRRTPSETSSGGRVGSEEAFSRARRRRSAAYPGQFTHGPPDEATLMIAVQFRRSRRRRRLMRATETARPGEHCAQYCRRRRAADDNTGPGLDIRGRPRPALQFQARNIGGRQAGVAG
jgi:hypothetical protein